jgi:hypothetical protein
MKNFKQEQTQILNRRMWQSRPGSVGRQCGRAVPALWAGSAAGRRCHPLPHLPLCALCVLLLIPPAFSQMDSPGFVGALNRPAAVASGSKNFVSNNIFTNNPYAGTSVSVTPLHAGDCLVAMCDVSTALVTLTVTGGTGNTWVTQQNVDAHTLNSLDGTAKTMCLATCLNCVSGTYNVSFSSSGGASDPSIVVVEYGGVTGVDTSGAADNGNVNAGTITLTTGATDLFVLGQFNENNALITSVLLNPSGIDVAANQLQKQGSHYDASFEWLNGSAGYASGTYALQFTGSSLSLFAAVALK